MMQPGAAAELRLENLPVHSKLRALHQSAALKLLLDSVDLRVLHAFLSSYDTVLHLQRLSLTAVIVRMRSKQGAARAASDLDGKQIMNSVMCGCS